MHEYYKFMVRPLLTGTYSFTPSPILAYLKLDKAPNVIVVDWSEYSGLPYYSATSNAPQVAGRTARLIQILLEEKVIPSLAQVHFIGHSLGAHIAGMTGTALQDLQPGKLDRITG